MLRIALECRTASGTPRRAARAGASQNRGRDEPFILTEAPYLGRAACWNSSAGPTFSLKSETPVTNTASAAAPLAGPAPSFFSDSTTLKGKLTETFLSVRNETEGRAAPVSTD